MHLDGTLGDTKSVMGSIAYPNKHREQHHQAREDEMQGTTEETKDAPEGSGANITHLQQHGKLPVKKVAESLCIIKRRSLFQCDLATYSTFYFYPLHYTFALYSVLTVRECSGNTRLSCPFNAQQGRKQ